MATKVSEIHGDPLPENLPSFVERFNHSVTSYPDKIALVCTHQPPTLFNIQSEPLDDDGYRRNPYLRWTYKDLRSGIDRLISGLTSQGVHPGMALVTFLHNSAEYVLAYWAAIETDCVLVPINPRSLPNKEEISHMLSTVSIATSGQDLVFVIGNADLAQQVDSLPHSEDAVKIVVSDDEFLSGWTSFTDVMGLSKTGENPITSLVGSLQPPTSSLILFTSGTTSLPKGCEWSLSTASANANMKHGRVGSIQAGDSWCVVVPNNHALGWLCCTSAFSVGAAVVFPGPGFDPQSMMTALLLEKCTHTALVPTMMHAILSVEENRGRKSNLKNVMLGGSLVSPTALKQAIADLGSETVECQYGMTEGVIICTDGQSDPAKIINGDEVSVGWISGGGSIKMCAPDDKTPVARGVPGEIHVSGPNICKEYIGSKSDEFYRDSEGRDWFITGDRGVIDDQDRVYVVGRYKGIKVVIFKRALLMITRTYHQRRREYCACRYRVRPGKITQDGSAECAGCRSP
jgi:acyl-CoA synthetase (AMP-forming)/AMP-acid ligase II